VPRTASNIVASQVVGRAIREVRQRVGVTQAELAARMNSTAPYISGLENGRANPTVGQLSAVADALRVELHVEFHVPTPSPAPVIPEPPDRRASL
jgi:transcriptional regulator with XRE-family HTH domain